MTIRPTRQRFPQYHINNDIHARNAIKKPIYKPNETLGVGFDETLHNMNYRVEYVTKSQKVIVPDVTQLSYETGRVGSDRGSLDEEDFPQTHYIGDPFDTAPIDDDPSPDDPEGGGSSDG